MDEAMYLTKRKEITIELLVKPRTIQVDAFEFMEMLEKERSNLDDGYIPDRLWLWLLEEISNGKIGKWGLHPTCCTPKYIVGNLAFNSYCGDFDKFKRKGESDSDFIKRWQGKATAIYPNERFIIINTGLE